MIHSIILPIIKENIKNNYKGNERFLHADMLLLKGLLRYCWSRHTYYKMHGYIEPGILERFKDLANMHLKLYELNSIRAKIAT